MKWHNFQAFPWAHQASLICNPRLGRKLAIKKINSDLEYKGYNLTNPHSGFVNKEALPQATADGHFSKDQVTSAQLRHSRNIGERSPRECSSADTSLPTLHPLLCEEQGKLSRAPSKGKAGPAIKQ